MPKIVNRDEVREKIREAAWQAFSENGVKGTGLEHVSKAAGVGRSSLYHYYPSKDALLADLTKNMLLEEEQIFSEFALSDGSPTERISQLADRLLETFTSWSAISSPVSDLRGIENGQFRAFYKKVTKDLADIIQDGQKSGEFDSSLDARQTSVCIIGLVDGLLLQYVADPVTFGKMSGWEETTKQSVLRILGI
jgi:AcrR family transcriptional regulator